MRYLKNFLLTGLLLLVLLPGSFGQPAAPDLHYKFHRGTSVLQDRIFYLFT